MIHKTSRTAVTTTETETTYTTKFHSEDLATAAWQGVPTFWHGKQVVKNELEFEKSGDFTVITVVRN